MQFKDRDLKDKELSDACAAGDRKAQHTLFERFKNVMFGVCMRFGDSRATAEDLLQEGFIRVFRDIGKYRGEGSLEGWVRNVFVRTSIAYLQKNKALPKFVDEHWLDNTLAELPEDFDPYDINSAIALLQKLPPGFRAVLNLSILEDKTHEEIANILGISASTSRSQLSRAKAYLRKIIEKSLIFL
ncbi:MAG: RNA polymerase sigma factor [Saprospiraceae bacterium]